LVAVGAGVADEAVAAVVGAAVVVTTEVVVAAAVVVTAGVGVPPTGKGPTTTVPPVEAGVVVSATGVAEG